MTKAGAKGKTGPLRLAGYARISVSKDDSVSVAAQREMLEWYAKTHGHALTLYVDDGFSGSKNIERPAYEQMMLAVRTGKVDAVLVKSVDRLGRRLGKFIELADKVRIIVIESGMDTGTKDGRMMLSMLATFAEYEAMLMAERQALSTAHRKREGRATAVPPFGYGSEERDGAKYRVIIPEQAEIIRRVGLALAEGASVRAAARMLNEAGARTRRGGVWTASNTSNLFRNPQLAGMRRQGEHVLLGDNGLPIVDEHLAIFSATEWAAIRAAQADRREFAPRDVKHEHLPLTGIVICDCCGRRMVRGGSRGFVTYKCPGDAAQCADRPSISVERLHRYLRDQLTPFVAMPVTVRQIEPDPVAMQERSLIAMEIDAITGTMRTASADEILDLAERLSGLRRALDGIDVEEVVTVVETGQTVADLLDTDLGTVVSGAFGQIRVTRATGTRQPVAERVILGDPEGVIDPD